MIFHTNPILFILIYFFKNSFSHENKNISLCKALNDAKFKNIYNFQKFISYDFIPSKIFSNSFLHVEATKIKNNEKIINFKNKKRKIRRAMDLKTLENKSKETPKCQIKNGGIYGEEGEERKKARIMKNKNGFWTQV